MLSMFSLLNLGLLKVFFLISMEIQLHFSMSFSHTKIYTKESVSRMKTGPNLISTHNHHEGQLCKIFFLHLTYPAHS